MLTQTHGHTDNGQWAITKAHLEDNYCRGTEQIFLNYCRGLGETRHVITLLNKHSNKPFYVILDE